MKKILALSMAAMMVLAVAGCSNTTPSSSTPETSTPAESTAPVATEFKVAMVTDTGGINDQSFNQSAWEGLSKLQSDLGFKASYVESKQEADYTGNLDKLIDAENDLIWGVGFMMADAVLNAAKTNPTSNFAIVDNAYEETPANLTGVVFRAQEPSFLVGYIAGKMTKTDKVGFVGGVKGEVIDQFEYGYRAGVAYAAKELGKEIEVMVQYANSFGDEGLGKSIAKKMYTDGADIVFHAAGGVGNGVIEAAKEEGKYVIGVDRDQNYLAPDNVITSAMKLVGQAMYNVSLEAQSGNEIGGKTLAYGIKEGCAGIAPTSDKLVPAEILAATTELEKKIVSDEIVPPANEESFNAYVESLK